MYLIVLLARDVQFSESVIVSESAESIYKLCIRHLYLLDRVDILCEVWTMLPVYIQDAVVQKKEYVELFK